MKALLRVFVACTLVLATTSSAWAAGASPKPARIERKSAAVLLGPSSVDSMVRGDGAGKRRAQSPPEVPGAASEAATTSIVVGYSASAEATALESASLMGAKLSRKAKSGGFAVVKVPPGTDAGAFARKLAARPGVKFAEPDGVVRASMASNDPGFSSQWGVTRIGAPGAWDVTRGSGVKVAVVDTGVDLDHPDLVGRLDTANDYDFVNGDATAEDDQGHGTHVAGIIAATLNNSVGVAGVANECTILPVKVLGSNGSGTNSQVADGIRHAALNGAKVINLSLGSPSYSSVINDAVQYAVALDCVVVAATGNDGRLGVSYPARLANVVGVGSTDSMDALSYFSNVGPEVDVTAPGSDIYSTLRGGGYGTMSGTSMATPHVAGVVALIRAQNPTWARAAVEGRLAATAVDLGMAGWDRDFGYGRVNAAAAVGSTYVPPVVPLDDDIPGVPAPESPISGDLDSVSDTDDVFSIYLATGDTLSARLDGDAGTDFDLGLFGPGATSIGVDPPVASSVLPYYPDWFQYTAPASGTYYFDAQAYSGAGGYSITYGVRPAGAAADDDIPGVAAPASPITGSLDAASDPHDVYALDMVAGQTLSVSLGGPDGTDFDAYLFGPDSLSVKIDSPLAAAFGMTYPDTFGYVIPVSGTYYLDLHGYSGSGAYALDYTIAQPEADGDVPGIPFVPNPRADSLNSSFDRTDVYSLSLTAGRQVTLTLSGPSSADVDFDLYLFGPGTGSVYTDSALAVSNGYTSDEAITYTPSTTGTYYVACYAFGGSGAYTLSQTGGNNPPVAVADTARAAYGGVLTVAAPGVLANDTDKDGDGLTSSLVSTTSNGSLTLSTNGGYVYRPNPGFTGTDSFTYRASDGTDQSAPAAVTITVDPPPILPTAITIRTNATTARIGGIPVLSGSVSPGGLVGKVIVVYVKKPGKRFWTYSSNRGVYASGGIGGWSYKYFFKKGMTKGVYYFKAGVPAMTGFTGSESGMVTIRLR